MDNSEHQAGGERVRPSANWKRRLWRVGGGGGVGGGGFFFSRRGGGGGGDLPDNWAAAEMAVSVDQRRDFGDRAFPGAQGGAFYRIRGVGGVGRAGVRRVEARVVTAVVVCVRGRVGGGLFFIGRISSDLRGVAD